mmetsp:Transcript_9869/g.28268  ORF Transcript_9869/g.28268 Transcript_9869/m.28268 type:complete len:95 (+) Transcript_9869:763-1047(+)
MPLSAEAVDLGTDSLGSVPAGGSADKLACMVGELGAFRGLKVAAGVLGCEASLALSLSTANRDRVRSTGDPGRGLLFTAPSPVTMFFGRLATSW